MVAKTVQRISVRIDWTKDDAGKYEIQIVMGSNDFFSSGTAISNKIKQFKRKYLELVKKAQKIFYGKKFDEKKKYQDLSSLVYYRIGDILQKFNKKIENEFEIINYTQAISRDFGLSQDYIYDLLTVVQVFKKDEIIKSIPFSYYRALKRKRSELTRLGLFEQEKKRLNRMGNEKKLPGREKYKVELIDIIKKECLLKSSKEKKIPIKLSPMRSKSS